MNSRFEKIMIYIIAALFGVAMIGNTILNMNGIRIPGFFSFTLCVCAILLLITMLKAEKKRAIDIVLISVGAATCLLTGIIQIVF